MAGSTSHTGIDPACKNCRYGKHDVKNLKGPLLCTRYPPSIIPQSVRGPGGMSGMQITGFFPPVNPNEWCGEHKHKISGMGPSEPLTMGDDNG